MALSDCPKCWDTPCTCGYMWESWSVASLTKHIAMLARIRDNKISCNGFTENERSYFGLKLCPHCFRAENDNG